MKTKGHGSTELNGEVVAMVCGVVERVNKLVYVCTLRAIYKPEVGDIIVGRVIEVAPKRWRLLDTNYSQDAVLMLSSINLPDGIQDLFSLLVVITQIENGWICKKMEDERC
ncbi:exosome complex component RRP4 homolog isoform X2 [Syzygium oleosum]|uniref:exosome complex component RRP4 homolog isoform X2 n=1 Tax=Syzygium oleosum TaxID=219896 RepID=UPI0024B8B52E|nr:exosome complex component RRP4 homolog isoform X2 [Syzygium oleosum]